MIKKSLNSLGNKSFIIDVCLALQTVRRDLEIKKTPCISVTDNKFFKNWSNILKYAELTLMRELTEKNKCIYCELYSEFFIQIEEAIENNIDIAIIRDLKQYFSKIENELFNRRITKFVEVAKDPDTRLLREKIRVANYLSNELNNLYLSYAKQLDHITTWSDQSKRQREKANKE